MRALILYRDIMPALETLSDQQLGALTRAALALVQGRDEPPDDPALTFAWTVLREKVTEQGQKYDEAAEARAERARRARRAQEERKPTQADASQRKPTQADASRPLRNKTKQNETKQY